MKKYRIFMVAILVFCFSFSACSNSSASNANRDVSTTGANGVIAKTSTTKKYSSANTSISIKKAKKIALKDAGVKSKNAKFTKAKLDYDNGVKAYEIEFIAGTKKYEYDINVSSGSIIEQSVKKIKRTAKKTNIKVKKAKKIALNDARVKSKNAKFIKVKLDSDDGVTMYEIEFIAGTKKYEYDISVSDGSIIEKSVKKIKLKATNTNITVKKAKKIALNDAGVSSKNATFTKAKLDYEDGMKKYEIEFFANGNEYDYEIDAVNGNIIEKDVEAMYD